jgi:hypothetical protein
MVRAAAGCQWPGQPTVVANRANLSLGSVGHVHLVDLPIIPERERIWVLALLGFGIFLLAGWRRRSETLLFSAAYTIAALALFGCHVGFPGCISRISLCFFFFPASGRETPDRYPLDSTMHAVIIIGWIEPLAFSFVLGVEIASGFYLTASWSTFALILFTAGIVLRERICPGWGCCARLLVGPRRGVRYGLETLYRILSLMALGIVLLVLGFVYNKYQRRLESGVTHGSLAKSEIE